MKPIEKAHRLVKNIHNAQFEPFVWEGRTEEGQSILQLDQDRPLGTGFHIYKMAPGSTTTFHEHTSDEHFLVIEGDMTDHDGYQYKPGDIVLLKKGTRHNSTSKNGCVLAVFIESSESSLDISAGTPGSR